MNEPSEAGAQGRRIKDLRCPPRKKLPYSKREPLELGASSDLPCKGKDIGQHLLVKTVEREVESNALNIPPLASMAGLKAGLGVRAPS